MWEPGKTLKEHLETIFEQCFLEHNGSRLKTAKALGISIRTVGNHLHKNPKLKAIYADEAFRKAVRTIKANEWLRLVDDKRDE